MASSDGDIDEEEHKTYELDATVLDEYAAPGLPGFLVFFRA